MTIDSSHNFLSNIWIGFKTLDNKSGIGRTFSSCGSKWANYVTILWNDGTFISSSLTELIINTSEIKEINIY